MAQPSGDSEGLNAMLSSINPNLSNAVRFVQTDYLGRPFAPKFAECDLHGQYRQVFLNEHGVPLSNPECPACVKNRAVSRLMGCASIPERYESIGFEHYTTNTGNQAQREDMRRKLSVCKAYAKNFKRNLDDGACLSLIGKTGTGKTLLACAIANSLLKRGYSPQYAKWDDIVLRVRESWGQSEEQERKIIRDFAKPDLLIIDEIGARMGDDNAKGIINSIIDERYLAIKPTLLISNLTKEEFIAFVGERVADRVRDNGGNLMTFNYGSMRG